MTASLLLLIAGLAGSALCAGTETGYYALNPLKLRVRAASSRVRTPVPQAMSSSRASRTRPR